jgi:hypothetical protein
MAESAEELSKQALELDAEAARAGDESATGRKLRAQAAELRIRAIGERIYPVSFCASCFRLTGWTDAAGNCDSCVRRRQLLAAYADPHGDLVPMATPPEPARVAGKPLRSRLAALVDPGDAANREWLSLVEPDDTGPISPEAGFELEVARRDETPAADDSSAIVIRFFTTTAHFDGKTWERRGTTRIRHAEILVPTEFSAGLPIEQLTEAWGDYGNAVALYNRAAWQRERDAREQQRQAQQAGRDTLAGQQHVTELLHEEGPP